MTLPGTALTSFDLADQGNVAALAVRLDRVGLFPAPRIVDDGPIRWHWNEVKQPPVGKRKR